MCAIAEGEKLRAFALSLFSFLSPPLGGKERAWQCVDPSESF